MEPILVSKQPPHEHVPVIGYDEFGSSFHVMRDVCENHKEVKWLSSITFTPIPFNIIKWKLDERK